MLIPISHTLASLHRPNAVVFSEPANTGRVRALFAHFLSLEPSADAVAAKVGEEEIAAVGKAFGFEPLPQGQVQKTYLTKVSKRKIKSNPTALRHNMHSKECNLTSTLLLIGNAIVLALERTNLLTKLNRNGNASTMLCSALTFIHLRLAPDHWCFTTKPELVTSASPR